MLIRADFTAIYPHRSAASVSSASKFGIAGGAFMELDKGDDQWNNSKKAHYI
jgi:hypothetical protein